MRSRASLVAAWLVVVPAAGCGDSQCTAFAYGSAGSSESDCPSRTSRQPGENLPEGGELRHERARVFGSEQSWIQLYRFTGPAFAASAPFPTPDQNGNGPLGFCVDERDPLKATWPFKPIEGATYLDFPTTALTGPGLAGSLAIAKTTPPNMIGNSTYRTYDFTYGGGQPGTASPGFNGTLSVDESRAGGHYTLDIGIGAPMDYYMPPAYTPPLDIGGADTVLIPSSRALDLTWEAPTVDRGEDGMTRTKKTYYAALIFIDPAGAFAPQFMCFTDEDGHQSIPEAVLAALPGEGIVMHVETTHYMEARDEDGEIRRFDLVAGLVNVSRYALY